MYRQREKNMFFAFAEMFQIGLNIRKTIVIHGWLGESLTAELGLAGNVTAITMKFTGVSLWFDDDDDGCDEWKFKNTKKLRKKKFFVDCKNLEIYKLNCKTFCLFSLKNWTHAINWFEKQTLTQLIEDF